MKRLLLWKQLFKQGAKAREARGLSDVSKGLSKNSPSLSGDKKKEIAQEIGFDLPKVGSYGRVATAGASFGFVILIIAAQFAHPSSPLYAIKQGTDEIRSIIQPGFEKNDDKSEQNEDRDSSQEINDDTTENYDDSERSAGENETEAEGSEDESRNEVENTEDVEKVEVQSQETEKPEDSEDPAQPESEDSGESQESED